MANPKALQDALNALDSLRRHWPEYLMEAGETGCYLFSACVLATVLWHPGSPLQPYFRNDAVRRTCMGVGMGATIILIVHSPWGKQSGAHFNPAVTLAFYRLRKVASWDALFYCASQLIGAVAGVALATAVLWGAPAHKAVRYSATLPGSYGNTGAFAAEVVVSFLLMMAVLVASNHRDLAPYTRYFAALLIASGIALESPVSGMSANPARTFGPAICGGIGKACGSIWQRRPWACLRPERYFYSPETEKVLFARSSTTTTTSAASSATPKRLPQR